jgi:hypothetical protein
MGDENNGWAEYKRLVLKQLEDLTHEIEKLNERVDTLITDVVILKTKAWLFGVLGGVAVTTIFQLLLKFVK